MRRGTYGLVLGLIATVMALAAVLVLPAVPGAWAPANTATIHPGVQTHTEGGQCTANFIFQEGETVFIGQAAHCSGTGGQTETDGCTSGSLPLGTPVEVSGANQPGTLVYNSWLAMQAAGETDPDTCAYNDLALVRLDAADVANVNPSVPGFGGPTGVGTVGDLGSTRLLLRQLRTARRDHQAEPEAGHRDPERRQRLEPQRRSP